jgi:NAD-dependent dihydropyrimidine dehydrogenase PreA subunit
MDVMYYDATSNKSVIAYIHQCITCGQCWLNCPSGSLAIQSEIVDFAINAGR